MRNLSVSDPTPNVDVEEEEVDEVERVVEDEDEVVAEMRKT